MNKLLFAIIFMLLASSALSEDRPRVVSIINLIATPERYDGLLVSVQGYFTTSPMTLYVNEGSARRFDTVSGVDVIDATDDARFAKSRCHRSYVRMVGKFQEYKDMKDLYFIEPVRIDQVHGDKECVQ